MSDQTTDTAADDNLVSSAKVLENVADELTKALAACVNIEEIIADRLLAGGADSHFIRMELQNIDRLIQTLTDIRSLTRHMSTTGPDAMLDSAQLRKQMAMQDLADRLLAHVPSSQAEMAKPGSDITFF